MHPLFTLRCGRVAAGLVLLWLFLLNTGHAAGLPGPLVSAAWLKQNLGKPDLIVVDASPPPLHAQRHLPGAVLSTLMTFGPHDPSPEEFERQVRSWGVGPAQRIVLYDQGGTYMAPRLYWDLVHRGFPADRVALLDGGLTKWVVEGGVVTADPTPAATPGTVKLGSTRAELRVRLPEFLVASGDPQRHVMLEALEPEYFFGGAGFFNRAGHVPNATLLPSDDLFNADQTFKSPAEMQRMLDHLGVRRNQHVLTYCGGGGAAAVPYFVLKHVLNYPQVSLFQESQMAWLQDERELPVWTYGNPHLVRDTAWLQAWGSPMLKAFGLSQVSIIDVRPSEAYKLGHIELAVNLPLQKMLEQHKAGPRALAALLEQAGVNPQHEAVVVADGGLSASAAQAWWLLHSLGQHKVSVMLDSTERWAELGHNVVRPAAAAATPSATAPDAATTIMRAAPYAPQPRIGQLLSDLSSSQGVYPKVYVAAGASIPADAPAGRVLHLPAAQLLNSDGTPKAAKDIWALLKAAGVPRYAELIVFADHLGEAATSAMVLRLMGLADVKVWER